ncbi:hypothetical protein AAVH_31076, partial [Aphelenchoides avenae]
YDEPDGHTHEIRIGPNNLLKREQSQGCQLTIYWNEDKDWVRLYPFQRESVDYTRGHPRLASGYLN